VLLLVVGYAGYRKAKAKGGAFRHFAELPLKLESL
jgi:hypothetical protein